MATVGEVVINSKHYMLALDANGKKAWQVRQLFMQPPSLLKEKIDMTILAAPQMRDNATPTPVVVTDRDIATVLAELRTLADAVAAVTMTGKDAQTYKVLCDQTATNARTILDPTGRIVQYEIDLSLWSLYQP